jgi:hypothetical protein
MQRTPKFPVRKCFCKPELQLMCLTKEISRAEQQEVAFLKSSRLPDRID